MFMILHMPSRAKKFEEQVYVCIVLMTLPMTSRAKKFEEQVYISVYDPTHDFQGLENRYIIYYSVYDPTHDFQGKEV